MVNVFPKSVVGHHATGRIDPSQYVFLSCGHSVCDMAAMRHCLEGATVYGWAASATEDTFRTFSAFSDSTVVKWYICQSSILIQRPNTF